MASAGTAYIDIEAKLDGLMADVDAAVANLSPQVEVGASVDEAQGEIDSLNADPINVDVGAQVDEAQGEIDSLNADPITVDVGANVEEAQSQIDGLGDSLSAALDSLGGSGGGGAGALDAFAGAALGAGSASSIAATGGIAALAAGLGISVSNAAEAEVAQARLAQILETTGAGAYVTQDSLMGLATEIQNYSGQSDEAIQTSEALLLTFSGLSNEASINAGILERATKATADIAALMGGDAAGAALRLGRALDDPARGMSMLQRSGVSFTESQKEVIQSLYESGDVLGAQSALLDVVEGQLGGVAAAYGDTMAGEVDRAKEKLGDVSELIGGAVIPILGDLAGVLEQSAEGWIYLDQVSNDFWENQKAQNLDEGPDPEHDPFGHQQLAYWAERAATNLGLIDPAAKRVLGPLGAASDAAGDAADETDRFSQSLITLDDRTQTYLDGVYRVPDAERALRSALETAKEVLTDPEHTYDEAAVALQGVAVATADLGVATGDAAGAVDVAKFGLLGLTGQGAEADAQVSDLNTTLDNLPGVVEPEVRVPTAVTSRTQVGDLGDALLGIDRTYNPYVGVRVGRAGFDQLVKDLEAAEVRRFTMQVSVNDPPRRASGGPVSRGESYLVGEEGPEMFVPRTSGTILSAPVTAGLGGNTYNVTVNAHGGNADDIARVVTDELRRLERAGR